MDAYDIDIQYFIKQYDLTKFKKFYFNFSEGVNHIKNIINNLPITTEINYIYSLYDLDNLKDINYYIIFIEKVNN